MKDIVIVSCYTNTEYKEFLLNECIKKLKSIGKTTLIASHYPVPDYIVKKSDYYIYDNYNIDFKHKTLDNSPHCFVEENVGFKLEFLEKCHSPSLSRIFNLSLNFLKHLKYDYFTIIESDSEYDIEDLNKLDTIKDDLINSNKSFFFFKLRPYQFPYWESIGIHEVFESYCFGGFINKFLEKCTFPNDVETWISLYNTDYKNQHLEYYITSIFKNHSDECLILDSFRHIFKNSNINLTTVGDPSGIYYNINDENVPIIFLMNNQHKERKYFIRTSHWNIQNEITLNPNCWWFCGLNILNSDHDMSITICEEHNVISRNYYVISKHFLLNQKLTHRITFK